MSPEAFDDELERPSEVSWDDVVDVVCGGIGPGVLAQAIMFTDLGLTVELADAVSPAELTDPDTVAYLAAMTDDLGPLSRSPADLEVPLINAEPVKPLADRRCVKVEPFVGSHLRDWAARCVVSPFGVVYSAVPEAGMTAMRSESGETIHATVLGAYQCDTDRPGPALADWLAEQARQRGIAGHGLGLQQLIFEYGRVAGAAIGTPAGTRLVRVTAGVVLSAGAVSEGVEWPVQPELRNTLVQVAIVTRTGSRFGRVELLSGS